MERRDAEPRKVLGQQGEGGLEEAQFHFVVTGNFATTYTHIHPQVLDVAVQTETIKMTTKVPTLLHQAIVLL